MEQQADSSLATTPQVAMDSLALTVQEVAVPISPTEDAFLHSGHLLPVTHPGPMSRPQGTDWAFLILIAALLVLGLMRWSLPRRFEAFMRAFVDQSMAAQLFREDNSLNLRQLMLFASAGIFNLALIITQATRASGFWPASPLKIFLLALGGLTVAVLLRLSVNRLLGWVLDQGQSFAQHNFNTGLFLASLLPALLPISAIVYFGPAWSVPWAIGAAGVLAAVLYMQVLWRGMLVFMGAQGIPALHLLYYLCAFEIVPISVIIRVALRY